MGNPNAAGMRWLAIFSASMNASRKFTVSSMRYTVGFRVPGGTVRRKRSEHFASPSDPRDNHNSVTSVLVDNERHFRAGSHTIAG